jgi:hypothetical protein
MAYISTVNRFHCSTNSYDYNCRNKAYKLKQGDNSNDILAYCLLEIDKTIGDISSLNYEIIIDRIDKFYSINKNKSMYFWFS